MLTRRDVLKASVWIGVTTILPSGLLGKRNIRPERRDFDQPSCEYCERLAVCTEGCSAGIHRSVCRDHQGTIQPGRYAWSYTLPIAQNVSPELIDEP